VVPRPLPAATLISQVLDRGAHTAARDFARCASQVLDCGAQADARGAAQEKISFLVYKNVKWRIITRNSPGNYQMLTIIPGLS
jgi:hypothetical protein